ncbi:MAG: RluA family pseudouridine synthase [Leptolyngbyaceae cyanobacterium CSU_1_4]|nr:RluA family pseudouridine synthase [Leptolyngbyaceae cyanobacterium CSU_1_4]
MPRADFSDEPTYCYEGRCPQNGEWLQLPRTPEVEAIAHTFMQQLARDQQYASEGKMYGILLVESATGEQQVLKAFSGLLNGLSEVEGWVPPLPGRDRLARSEAETLAILAELKQEIITLQQIPERQQYQTLAHEFATHLQALAATHRQRKEQRQRDRQNTSDLQVLKQLEQQSQQDGIERRNLKREQDAILRPLKQIIERADDQMGELKRQRKLRSQRLQAQMYENYRLINFLGTSATLQQLMPAGMPSGTGDCCAPKLLHYAATHDLKPIAMAEFWWGAASADKVPGKFYGACADRCQPLMGFLLSGLPTTELSILHEDQWLIGVDKPAGLLSVPGRYGDRQDSVLTRLRLQGKTVFPVHRLDQETSGILLLAKDQKTHRHLSQQFQQRQVYKQYEAVLAETISSRYPSGNAPSQGTIELPLWGDPQERPRQKVDWQRGKPSKTQFRVLDETQNRTRVELVPLTGRTHQLRVHAVEGLRIPILGDRLYGCVAAATRLHLHAQELHFEHPQFNQTLVITAPVPQSTINYQEYK